MVKAKVPSLTTIPEELTQKILDDCDYPSIAALRKVNKSIRCFLERTIPKCSIPRVRVQFEETVIYFHISLNDNPLPYPEGGQLNITYIYGDANMIMNRDKPTNDILVHRVTNINANEVFFNDFSMILKHLKQPIECFEVEDVDFVKEVFDMVTMREFCQRMRNSNISIQAKKVSIIGTHFFNFEQFVPLMDPQSLKKMTLSNEEDQDFIYIRELFGMEQWRQCQELELNASSTSRCDINNFLHFTRLNAHVLLNDSYVMILKQAFLRSGPPKHYRFTGNGFISSSGLGPSFEIQRTDNWYYSSTVTDQVLHIMIESRPILPSILEMKFISRSDVPQGAVIQDGEAPVLQE